MERRRIAVVGGGVAGLTAAHVLQRACDVTLYEADDRLGGHAHTHDVAEGGEAALRVDSGFIVHNERTYPLLLRLFRELGVSTQDAEMSMSVRCDGCGLQYAGARGPAGLFAQPRSVLRGRYLRMLGQVPAFHRAARAALASDREGALSLGEFLAQGGFTAYFVHHFVTPLVSAVWSCAPEIAMRYPATYLFRFLEHHGMLSVRGAPQWRTVTGGSVEYVSRVAKQLSAVHTATPVRAVRREPGRARIVTDDGGELAYDAVVIAVHPDQALRLLAAPTPEERQVLGAFRYSRNETVLHTDATLLPSARGARASWNYLMPSCSSPADKVQVSYDMSRLQRLASRHPYIVTLNAADRIGPDRVLARMTYEHPVYTRESVAAQRRLPDLNTTTTVYAGAYHGWGFHEDGCRSGVRAAAALGVTW
ncbi:FAD-dependent oxidoreductase [Streptomyces sp. ASQP_92]|uniref:NAD(P)/FAD-dependent oxidoreductase n=1 Tax=Streptomyces sp. ASQP_92 TaxID=2979116 RepID=UPI0021C07EAD|nr:FAD-dependent oxidoreductase [Streptomyces sp. ASQP_92]MCT9094300.1 FAD-dependent oxidoreductase [Streptomyces sp. ASQP_92]